MSAAWMIAASLVSVLVAMAALSLERVLTLRRGAPLRWTWVVAIALAIGLSARWLLPDRQMPNPAPSGPIAPVVRNQAAVITHQPLAPPAPETSRAWMRRRMESLLPRWSEQNEQAIRAGWVALSATLFLLLVWSQARLSRDRRSWQAALVQNQRVVISDGFGPAIVGVLRPTIVVPPWVLTLDASAQRAVLAHEDEHRRAGDPWLLLSALLALVVMPWNVGIWMMWRRLGRAIELDCDERVLHRGVASAEYADVLLGAWQRARGGLSWAASPALAERVSGLGRRVEHLMRPTPRRWIMKTMTGSLVSALLIGATLLVPTPQQAQRKPVPAQPAVIVTTAQPAAVPTEVRVIPVTPRTPISATRVDPARNPDVVQDSAFLQYKIVVKGQSIERVPVATPALPEVTPALPVPPPATSSAVAAVPAVARMDLVTPQRRGRILIAAPLDSVGSEIARAVHSRLVADASGRPVYVIPQADFEEIMRVAGFQTSAGLVGPRDLRSLAKLTRADVLVALAITKGANGLRVEGSVASGSGFELRVISDNVGTVDHVSDQVLQALRADSAYVRLRNRQP